MLKRDRYFDIFPRCRDPLNEIIKLANRYAENVNFLSGRLSAFETDLYDTFASCHASQYFPFFLSLFFLTALPIAFSRTDSWLRIIITFRADYRRQAVTRF